VKTVNPTEALLLDASVWVLLVDPADRYHRGAADLIRSRPASLAALDLTLHEVGNAIGVKRGNAREAMNVLRLLLACCRDRVVSADAGLADSALEIASEHSLTAYDAAYVAVARRHGWTLVSTDIADLVSKGLAVTPDAADYPLSG
jgi:predicted nucleic acid-binding protein